MLHYQEFLPHPALRDIIHLYGVLGDDTIYASPQIQKTPPVINKGLLFHYRRDTNLFVDNGHYRGELPKAYILPQGSAANVWRHRGGFGIFSVIFKPGKFRHLFPQSFLPHLNGSLDLDTFNDRSLLTLRDRVFAAKNHRERIILCDQYFLKRIWPLQLSTDWLQQAWQLIESQPQSNMECIAGQVYKSNSQFRKRFTRAFGIPPKKLQQLLRITAAVNALNYQPNTKLTDIALQCGYTDQSHFIHHFKSFTDQSPLQFKKAQENITKLINYHEVVRDGMGR